MTKEQSKKVVMACANYWTTPFQVGSHHFARAFARKGWEVAFVSDPISPLHFFKRPPGLKDRFDIYRRGGLSQGGIWSYVPGSLFSPCNYPLLRSRWLHKHWPLLTFPSEISKLKERGFDRPDLLYYDSPTQAHLLQALSPKHSIYRLADYNKAFNQTADAKKEMEEELLKEVDCVVYTAQELKGYVASMRPKRMKFVSNGVDVDHFLKEHSPPPEYGNFKGPIAVYVGAIREWFDVDLIHAAAQALPHVDFVVIGPNDGRHFKSAPNLHLIGPRKWEVLPAYLQHADVGLIPFDVKGHPELIHRVNPLKLYEYMACGLPVVSMKWDELVHLNSPAFLATSKEEFISMVQEARPSPIYPTFARQHDWSTRSEQLMALLTDNNGNDL